MSNENLEQLGEMLSAYLDGELGDADRVRVEELLQRDAAARQLLDELRQTVAAVSSLPRHAAPDSILASVRQSVERRELVSALDDASDSGPTTGRLRTVRWLAAAMIGFAAIGGIWTLVGQYGGRRDTGETVAMRDASKLDSPRVGASRDYGAAREGIRSSQSKETLALGESEAARMRQDSASPAPVVDRRERSMRTRAMRRPSGGPSDSKSLSAGATATQRTIAAKLAEGSDTAMLAQHPFAAEPLRIRIDVGSEADRARLVRALSRRLQEYGVPRLGPSHPDAGRAAAQQAFYLPGQAGVNFPDRSRNQILVRAPLADLRDLLQFAGVQTSARDVSLFVRESRVQGANEADKVLQNAQISNVLPDLIAHAWTPSGGAPQETTTSPDSMASGAEAPYEGAAGAVRSASPKKEAESHGTDVDDRDATAARQDAPEPSLVQRRFEAARQQEAAPQGAADVPAIQRPLLTVVFDVGIRPSAAPPAPRGAFKPRLTPEASNANQNGQSTHGVSPRR